MGDGQASGGERERGREREEEEEKKTAGQCKIAKRDWGERCVRRTRR